MSILVTSKRRDATLEILTRDKNVHYIPPKARKLKVNIRQEDIISASKDLIIVSVDNT